MILKVINIAKVLQKESNMSGTRDIWTKLVKLDHFLVKLLSVSSSNDSILGNLRPYFKSFEMVGYGGIWLFVIPVVFVMVRDPVVKEKLLNLQIG